jgi:hypothetical protein
MDRSEYSPAMLGKIVYAGVNNSSFAQGSEDLAQLSEVQVSTKQVERVCQRIGQERCRQRDQQVQEYQDKPLMQRKDVPQGVTAPSLAVVQVDGGRLQILERGQSEAPEEEPLEPETVEAEEGRRGKHWREDKIGLLMTMTSKPGEHDPCPSIPKTFVDPTRIVKLARELKKRPPIHDDGLKEGEEPESAAQTLASTDAEWEPPEVEQKRLVSSRCRWPLFGPLLATAAWKWGFFGAKRKAFVGDGSDNNWTIWRKHFSSFEPILDFIHALSYVFAAAMAGRSYAAGWAIYVQWITWVWQGEVSKVIAALAERQVELGEAEEGEAESSPRKVVATTLGYLQNHKERMQYPKYRRQGMPITSSYVESAVKQFNKRVKGTEKFWTEEGAEAMLQLRADYLSDDKPMETFWQERQNNETGQRHYSMAA